LNRAFAHINPAIYVPMQGPSEQLPQGRYLHCPDGSHLAQFDDPGHYFPGLIDFLTSL
jgi:proline iminopeptidase